MQTSLSEQQAYVKRLMQSSKNHDDYLILNDIASSIAALRIYQFLDSKPNPDEKELRNESCND